MFKETVSNSNVILTFYLHVQMLCTNLFLALKYILVYLHLSFYCLMDGIVD